MILGRFDPLSCSLERAYSCLHARFLMNKTKDQISWVSSHDLYWENKMYKRKRSISSGTFVEELLVHCFLIKLPHDSWRMFCVDKETCLQSALGVFQKAQKQSLRRWNDWFFVFTFWTNLKCSPMRHNWCKIQSQSWLVCSGLWLVV